MPRSCTQFHWALAGRGGTGSIFSFRFSGASRAMSYDRLVHAVGVLLMMSSGGIATGAAVAADRPRARERAWKSGFCARGRECDHRCRGVAVGHATLVEGKRVHTGVTAVCPMLEISFRTRCRRASGAMVSASSWAAPGRGMGEIETPILLTNTLSVPEAAAASIEWTLRQKGNEKVRRSRHRRRDQ